MFEALIGMEKKLQQFYDSFRQSGKKIEIVFISWCFNIILIIILY